MARSTSAPRSWSRPVRVLVTLWLFWHFSALVVAAAAAPPSAQVVRDLWQVFRPYLELLYLNHAYRFYSPEPGPTMVMRYRLTLPDGQTQEDWFPKRSDYWLRLQYQRRLALANALSPLKLNPQTGRPGQPLILGESYARYLQRLYGAESVELARVLHLPMPIDDARKGADPRDQRFYLPPDRLGVLKKDGEQFVWRPDRNPPPGLERPRSTRGEPEPFQRPAP
jgi:hypothetical protein